MEFIKWTELFLLIIFIYIVYGFIYETFFKN